MFLAAVQKVINFMTVANVSLEVESLRSASSKTHTEVPQSLFKIKQSKNFENVTVPSGLFD